ncbi:accessory Sec-dependent serine-rich glycoprotein adhesin, partial [Ligilactobacillus salivarius]|uniref:accessory Sec-dependent serine-rich glycoprotein adhesin n=1 Tax=Ligilactobacillus salivarius TaxID=1624 RepID=UPI001EF73453
MKFRRNKKDFFEFENDRKTHVKLYKAGKQWVSSLISSIGLIRVFKGKLDKSTMNTQLVSKEKDKKSEDKLSSDGITAALKGAAALGAVAGGTVLTTNTALADTKQLDSNQNLVNKDRVNLSSGSGSSSVSDSLSTSESDVQTESSVSKSESVSLDTNTNSSSTSETRSDSNSRSESISESKSNSQSQASTSQSISRSESLASSSSINNSSNVTSSKAEFESMVNQASAFINSSEFKSADVAYQEAYKTAIQYFKETILSDPQSGLTDSEYAYGVQQLQELQQAIKSKETPQPQVFAANVGEDRSSNGFIGKGQVDIGTHVYDDFNKWAGYKTTSFGPNKTINVQVTTDSNNPNKKHWVITYLPEGFTYNSGATRYDKMTGDRMGFALTKDLTIDGQVKFENFYYQHNNDNAIFNSDNSKMTVVDKKTRDGDFYFKDGQLVLPGSGKPISNNIFYDGRGSWDNVWEQAIITPNFHTSDGKSLTLGEVKYYDNVNDIHDHFFNTSGTDDSSPRVATWAPTEKEYTNTGKGMFIDDMSKIGSSNYASIDSRAGQYNQDDFTKAYTWKSWGWTGNTQSATYVVSFDTISDPKIKEELHYSGIITALGTFKNNSDYNYGHLTGEKVSQDKEYRHIKVVVTNSYDTKGKNNVSIPKNDMTLSYIPISSTVDYTVKGENNTVETKTALVGNPYSKYNDGSRKIVEDMGSRTINDGDSKSKSQSYEYTISAVVPKDGVAKAYRGKDDPIKDDSGNYVTANFTRDNLAAATGISFENKGVLKIPNGDENRVDTYILKQTKEYKDGVWTITNTWVRQVKIESLEDDLDKYNNAIQNFLNYIGSDDFVNPWKFNPETKEITKQSSNYDTTAYQKKLDEVNKWKQRFSDDIKGLDPANKTSYGDKYGKLLKVYDNVASVFDSSSKKTGAGISSAISALRNLDLSNMPVKTGKEDAEGNPIYKIGQGDTLYKQPMIDTLIPFVQTIGSSTLKGTILYNQTKLRDYANDIMDNKDDKQLFKNATESKQTDFNNALKELKTQLDGVTDIKSMKNYYDLLTSANRLKEAIYHLKPSPAESESIKQSESLRASTSLSESLRASTSLSESLRASTSLSESLRASTSLSESLSASTSLSESLSASTSLSESLSASTSLSESLSASTSLSESLSASTSLSESLSASTSLSESLSASTSLSESLSASTSLSCLLYTS